MNTNGNEFSWPSYKIKVAGEEITAIKGVSWDHEIEGADHVYGTGQKPRGRTRGRYKPGDSSITFYLSGWKQFLALQPNGFGATRFDIVESYVEGSDVHTVVLEDCKILGGGGKSEEGTDPMEREVKFSFMRAIEDGKELVADE